MAVTDSRIVAGVAAIWAVTGAAMPSVAQEAPVTPDEAKMIREQIIPCWNVPMGIEHPENYRVVLDVALAPDGTVTSATVKEDRSRLYDLSYVAVAESALRAVEDPGCQPLRLPPGRHWTALDLVFDLEKAINGDY